MTISTPRDQAELDVFLRAGDPLADVNLRSPRLATALDEVGQAILLRTPARRARRRRPRTRRVLIIAVAALALAVGGAAAAGWFTNAHTRRYPRQAWEIKAGMSANLVRVRLHRARARLLREVSQEQPRPKRPAATSSA